MALDLGKTELSQILQQLSDESLENKSEPLQKLLSLAKDQTLNFSSEDLLEIFTHLKEILDVENLTYNVQCLGITQELIANYGKTTKAGFALVLSSLIDYLIDNTVSFESIVCFKRYVMSLAGEEKDEHENPGNFCGESGRLGPDF